MAIKEVKTKKEEDTLRDKLRYMKPGMTMTLPLGRMRDAAVVKSTASYLNSFEPELGIQFSCKSLTKERKIIVTANPVE